MTNPHKNTPRLKDLQYEKYAGIIKIINAFNSGINTIYDLSKYLHVSETFLKKAINYYKIKYGLYYEIDTYYICFYPTLSIISKYRLN